RAIAAYDGDTIVGTSATKPFELTVPGPVSVPVAGVTAVSVLPTHRRRGILTEMMRTELESAKRRGEIALVLYASEGLIYGRFGYGAATFAAEYAITRPGVQFASVERQEDEVRLVDTEEGRRRVPEIANRHACLQPGSIPRLQVDWNSWFDKAQRPSDGRSETFVVIHQDADGHDDGFLAYRSGPRGQWIWQPGTVEVSRLIALSDRAYAALWRYALRLDLVGEITAGSRPVQEPLRWLLADPRRLRTTGIYDALWVRLLDIPACLEGRRYFAEGSLTIQVNDAFYSANQGCYVLEITSGGAVCTRADADPDLALDVARLGSVYLGGVSFSELARGGLIEERRPGALLEADRMFLSPIAPWCTTHF
ncbi:MAG TPA: GNAT family N-acetyltransferase, partial [Chloroflexota bacterium]|nr:GNAT family N-acetyltransferase [Chloroflexota bacterium]